MAMAVTAWEPQGKKIPSHRLWDTLPWQRGGKGGAASGKQAARLQGKTLSDTRGYTSARCHAGSHLFSG